MVVSADRDPIGVVTGAKRERETLIHRIGAHPDNVNTVRGVVKRDRFMGSVRLYDIAVGKSVILGETGIRDDIDVVHIPPDDIQLIGD